MSRTEVFATYERVSAACAALREAGENISGRRLREELGGGSMSTINPLMARWLREEADRQAAENLIDSELTAALAAFVQRCSGEHAGAAREHVDALEATLAATSEDLAQAETRNVELEAELEGCQGEQADLATQFERYRVAAEAREAQVEKHEAERALELRQLRSGYEQARDASAAATAKLALMEARAAEAERLVAQAHQDGRAWHTERSEFQERLRARDQEVAEARAQADAKESAAAMAREQLADLRVQMQEERAERRAVVEKCDALIASLHGEKLLRSQAEMRIAHHEERARELEERARRERDEDVEVEVVSAKARRKGDKGSRPLDA